MIAAPASAPASAPSAQPQAGATHATSSTAAKPVAILPKGTTAPSDSATLQSKWQAILSSLGMSTTGAGLESAGAEADGPDAIAAEEASLARLNQVIGVQVIGAVLPTAQTAVGQSTNLAKSTAALFAGAPGDTTPSVAGKHADRNAHLSGLKSNSEQAQSPATTPGGTLDGSLGIATAAQLASLHPVRVQATPFESASSSTAANGATGKSAAKHTLAETSKASSPQTVAQDDSDDLSDASDLSADGGAAGLGNDSASTTADIAQRSSGLLDADSISAGAASLNVDAQKLGAPSLTSGAASSEAPAGTAMNTASLSPQATGEGEESARVRESAGKSRSGMTTAISSSGPASELSRPVSESSAAQPISGLHAAHASRMMSAGTSTSTTQASAEETFTTLDSGTQAQPTWVHVGSRSAEAGFIDPSLGWVGVRAELNGGAVHASVVPESAGAASTLGGHMAGLNSYLGSQQSSVASVTLATPSGSDGNPGSGAMQQGTGQGTGQGSNQGANQNNNQSSNAVNASVRTGAGNSTVTSRGQDVRGSNAAVFSANQNNPTSGGRISVMA